MQIGTCIEQTFNKPKQTRANKASMHLPIGICMLFNQDLKLHHMQMLDTGFNKRAFNKVVWQVDTSLEKQCLL